MDKVKEKSGKNIEKINENKEKAEKLKGKTFFCIDLKFIFLQIESYKNSNVFLKHNKELITKKMTMRFTVLFAECGR